MKPPRRVLVVQPYGIGDLLFITPVLRALRLMPGIERVDLLLGSRTEAVVENNPHIDEIMTVDKDRIRRQGTLKTWKELTALGKKLRERRYDLLLDYSLRGEYAFWARFFLGIPETAGFDYKRRGMFHTLKFRIPDGFTDRHAADYCASLAESAGIPVRDRWFEFYLSPQDRREAEKKTEACGAFREDFIVISPGGGESWGKDAHFKRWPPSFFARLSGHLKNLLGFENAVVVGSEKEKELGEQIIRAAGFPVVNLAGKITLKETVCAIENARLFLGNDGGLLHLACARKKPVIGFYGPVDPLVYGPYPPRTQHAAVFKEDLDCRPCYRKFRYRSDCLHQKCLKDLQPEEVMAFLTAKDFFRNIHPPG